MMIDFQYLLQVLMASAIFSLFFYGVMRASTFFRLNRFFLLGAMLSSVLIPFIHIPSFVPDELPNLIVMLDEVVVGDVVNESIRTVNYWPIAYVAVALVFLFRIFWGAKAANRILNGADKQEIRGQTVYVSDERVNPFSFFKRILIHRDLLNNDGELNKILRHETTHVRQGHSYDVFFTELMCALFWFNPFFWLLKKEIKSIHEYLADENVLEQDADLAGYFMLIFNNLLGRNVELTNNFNHSLNFKRMKMMKKKRSSRFAKMMSLIAIPALLLGALFMSSQAYSSGDLMTEVSQNDTVWAYDGESPKSDDINEIVVVGYGKSSKSPQKESEKSVSNPVVEEEKKDIKTEDMVFMVVEKMPQFPGGNDGLIQFLLTNVKYPAKAQENGTQGRVYVEFIINKEGKVTNAEILKGVDPELDKEALRVVGLMPDWKPGTQRGKLVNVSYRLPINFTLQEKKK